MILIEDIFKLPESGRPKQYYQKDIHPLPFWSIKRLSCRTKYKNASDVDLDND